MCCRRSIPLSDSRIIGHDCVGTYKKKINGKHSYKTCSWPCLRGPTGIPSVGQSKALGAPALTVHALSTESGISCRSKLEGTNSPRESDQSWRNAGVLIQCATPSTRHVIIRSISKMIASQSIVMRIIEEGDARVQGYLYTHDKYSHVSRNTTRRGT